ncbi:MAG: SHOCT domain-containing protein [Nocardioidaceae bacterium]|nr:SHOCT domain-containing protein [Nocardioidaceae bacterium]NUS50421.1 SHOCT domain-containing protein [Nocardioidaceae bacterium]
MSLWDVLVSIFWFMLLVAWFWLLITIITDLFRDNDLSGLAKAAWCIFVILLPWLGVLTYLLVRGRSMGDRAAAEAARNEQAFRSYVRDVAATNGGGGVADELGRLADLRDQGRITTEEYEQAKQRVLGGGPTAAATPPAHSAGTAPNVPA